MFAFCSPGERERRPDLGVLHRPGEVGVEGHLHLDHPVDRRGIAARLLGALGERGQEGVGVQLGALAAGADEPVAEASREPRRGGARGGDVDRQRLVGLVVHRGLVGPEEGAVEVDDLRTRGRERLDELDRLAEPGESLGLLGPVDAHRDLVHRLARPDAQDHAPGGKAAEGRERLGHDRRVVAERRREDGGPEGHPARRDRGRAQPHERVGRVAVGVAPGLEVVARPDRVEARRLGGDREVEEASRRELLRGRLVAESQGGHVILSGPSRERCRGRVAAARAPPQW